ncbi:MAG TPA: hypothetical protein VFK85_11190 [Anaeromyxobacteraceae bacterium]|nr:hypothetical protein [Anaeromyxobacteraceae bacterium]
MPKSSVARSLDEIIAAAIGDVVARTVASIERAIATQVELEVRAVAKPARGGRRAAAVKRTRRARPVELTRWVADKRARRVPNFVIELTGGLDTKKKIVARFGENAAFEQGKPLPASVAQLPKAEPKSAASKAKPPVVRKAAAK